MKKILKQTLSVLLAVVMTFTITLPAFAEENSVPETQTEQNLSYNSSNALGDAIVNAIDDENSVREEYDGKGVFYVSLAGLEATVSLSAPDDCTVVVSVYEEETMKMVTSGKASVGSDDTEVVVALADFELPDFFVVKVFILNSENEPVCPAYVDLYNTRAYVESMAKTTEDFDSELVINLDESTETNFAVVTEDAVVAQVDDEKNVIVSVDDENGIYVIENADNSITSLKTGEILYYTYGDNANDYILTKIGKIETKDGITTITASDEYEMSEFFDYIDIDTSKNDEQQTYGLRRDFNDDKGDSDKTVSFPLTSGEASLKFSGSNWSLSFKVDGAVCFHIKFFYDFHLFTKDYYEFSYWVQVNASANVTFDFKDSFVKKITVIDADFPVVPGLDIHFALMFTVKAQAELHVSGTVTFLMKNGASRNSGGEQQKIEQKPIVSFDVEVTGKVSFDLIPEIETGFRIVKVFFVDLNVPVDFNVTGILYVPTSSEEREKHSCNICIDGKIKATVSLNISVKFGLKRSKAETIISFTAASKTVDFGSFYISSKGSKIKFGWGECPNIVGQGGSGGAGSGSDDSGGSGSGSDYEEPNIREWWDIGRCGDNIVYTLYKDGELQIGGSGKMWNFSSGSSSDNLPPWEEYKDEIKTITIVGYGITNIGNYAFSDCKNLESITFTTGIKEIESYSFKDSNKLKDIYYSGSIADWGRIDGFDWIDEDVRIHYEKEATLLDYFDYTITNGEVSLDFCSKTLNGDILIPEKIKSYPVVSIGKNAFNGCESIKSIVIPDSVKTIGNSAFKNCYNIKSLTIGNGVTTIGEYAFECCYDIEQMIIGNNVTTIGKYAFKDCDSIESIIIPDSVILIGDYAFVDCMTLKTVTIGSGVATINNTAFRNCDWLEHITVSENNNNYSSDEYGVLFNKDKTVLIQYPSGSHNSEYFIPCGVITISDYAFYSCDSIDRIIIPSSVTTIGYVAFYNCEDLESITVDEDNLNYSNDEYGVLFNKDKTELIRFPTELSWIISDYTIPESVIKIGKFAFGRCYLSNIIIQTGVTTIEGGAFSECFLLESITIPDTVTKIEIMAFLGCFNLSTVYYSGTQVQWNQISGSSEIASLNPNIIYNYIPSTSSVMSLRPDNKSAAYTSDNIQTETITDALIGYDYVMIAVKDENADDLLAASNLLYIDQMTAESEELTFEYVIDESVTDYKVLVFGQKLAHYHLYNAVVTAPTCTAKGFTTYTCSCGDSYVDDYVEVSAHTDEVIPGYEATCTETGLTDGVKCSVCGTVTTEQEEIPATGHNDADKNGACDACGEDLTFDCSHSCHSSGFVNFFWKIINFLQKLFGVQSARYCECGIDHWS